MTSCYIFSFDPSVETLEEVSEDFNYFYKGSTSIGIYTALSSFGEPVEEFKDTYIIKHTSLEKLAKNLETPCMKPKLDNLEFPLILEFINDILKQGSYAYVIIER